jgi:hypothetical protein
MSFTQRVQSGASADGEYVYYNATIVNNTVVTTQTTDDPQVYFQDTRQYPLIKDTSQYVVSVDNFSLNGATKSLPLFLPQIAVGTDINKTIYTVSIGLTVGTAIGSGTATTTSTQTFVATIPLCWIPENQTAYTIVPTTATPRQAETNYYFGYSYEHWVDILNNALTQAWRAVMYEANLLQGVGGTRCPYFQYDPNSGLFSLIQDSLTSWLPYGTQKLAPTAVSSASQGVSDPSQPFAPFFPTNTYYGSGQGTTTGTGSGTGTSGAVAYSSVPYGSSEFSFVGMNSNLEGLMTNFDTIYFGGNSKVITSSATSYSYTQASSVVYPPGNIGIGTGTTSSGTGTISTWLAGTTLPVYYPENIINVVPDPNSILTLSPPWSSASSPLIYYFRETQNYISTGSLWSPIASFVLTTNQIPVRLEQNSNPVELGDSNSGGATGLSGSSQKVLLETPIDCVTADLWRGFVLYKPLTPLFSALDPSEGGLTNLDLRLGWRSRLTNEVIPVLLYNSGTVSFRLRFVKK